MCAGFRKAMMCSIEEEVMSASVLEAISNEFAAAAEAVGPSVVAVYARRWMPGSGVVWQKGVVVTADHNLRREEDITVVGADGKTTKAELAGRDPGTDVAILKLAPAFALAPIDDSASLKLGNFVLALGRSRSANVVASAGIVGAVGGEWRTWRGGRLDQHIRLDLNLYPGFSGGPLVSAQGKVVGINSRGLGRGRPVVIPAATVNRVAEELLKHGHIARPYLGLAMQPVAVPESLRGKMTSAGSSALLVVHVEPAGPAEKAGALLGDLVIELQGKPVEDTQHIQEVLHSAKVGDRVKITALRAGAPVQLDVTLGDRPGR
jgi:S1-C subfamily serine protease